MQSREENECEKPKEYRHEFSTVNNKCHLDLKNRYEHLRTRETKSYEQQDYEIDDNISFWNFKARGKKRLRPKEDVIITGDSTIKNTRRNKLSWTKHVKVRSCPGATVEEFYSYIGSTQNTTECPKKTVHKFEIKNICSEIRSISKVGVLC